jgi:hypothetical protein
MAACLQIPGPKRADYLFCVPPGDERRAAVSSAEWPGVVSSGTLR